MLGDGPGGYSWAAWTHLAARFGQWLDTPAGRAEVTRRPDAWDEAAERRRGRYARQRKLGPLLRPSMRACRRVRHRREGITVSVSSSGSAGFRGLNSCNCRSGCEHCGPRLLARDAELVTALVEDHGIERAALLTLTARHHAGVRLRPFRRGLANAFRKMRAHRQWRLCPELRDVEVIRSLEPTYGEENGWHPHLHIILLFSERLQRETRRKLERHIAHVWRGCVVRELGKAFRPNLRHGCDLAPLSRADYIAKLGLEIADAGQAKRSRNVEGRSYWQMVRDWIDAGAELSHPLAARIGEYIDDMRGAKIVTWSPGQKERAEALAPLVPLEEREAAFIMAEDWDHVRDVTDHDGSDARTAVLDAAELADFGGVQAAVDEVVTRLSRRPGLARAGPSPPAAATIAV